ncbi:MULTISPECIES: hypothetical protein [unclassified Flavobacterium]|uniref:hypothetical protein n=1 Tax=unclassified Flavobacterium TaxID=196869 RepID=UPI00086D9840|nr:MULTISPECIES: hypothetical protein [unclassified Flavobacterium]MBN9286268.1 hypothetical protein [Flavobacterium sp.]ODS79713.1 MAG: hypothetical protein ABS44_21025 [Chryseobacterium sp. SCN 40-13]OJV73789.1 MAG: hypothetical protein BGO42_14785 [Flavobacterium sp. 40-81]
MRKKILLKILLLCLLTSYGQKENGIRINTVEKIKTTPSEIVNFIPEINKRNGDYCAKVVVNDMKSAYTKNLVVRLSNDFLLAIYNDDNTVIKGFKKIHFDINGYTKFVTNGKTYQIKILAALEDCKGLPRRCKGKTQLGKRCKCITKDESGYCHHHK